MADPTNRSGGADFNANNLDIGGDVTGRDKISDNSSRPIYNYYDSRPSQPRRAELPSLPYFFGREDELKIIADALDPESDGWGVLIDGPGGIGKTALAIRAGHLAPDKIYPTKIFLSAKIRELTPQGEQRLDDFMLLGYVALLTELARELGDADIEKIAPNERTKEVRRLLENRHALILIDSLETFEEKQRERLFQFLRLLPRSCKAIVTSRHRSDATARIIHLDRLTMETAFKLITNLAGRNRLLASTTRQERSALYEATKGNPLLMEWTVGQLGRGTSQCRTIDQVCWYLERAPQDNDPLEHIFGDLFDTFTDTEVALLTLVSRFTLPAKDKWISIIANLALPLVQAALENLTDRSVLVCDVNAHTFIVQPLVTTFLRKKAIGTTEKIMDYQLINYAYTLAQENGYQKFDRFDAIEAEWPVILAALPLFLQDGHERLQLLCEALKDFLDFYGHWDEWLALSSQAEEYAISANDASWAVRRIFQVGWIYYLRGQPSEVLACAYRAKDHWSEAGLREKGYAIRLRGLGHELEKDHLASRLDFEEALNLFRTISSEGNDVAICLNDLAEVEESLGNLPAAERNFSEALHIAMKNNDLEGIATATGNLSVIALKQKDWWVAEKQARDGLALCESLGRQELIAANCCHLAKSLVRQGRPTEGLLHAYRAVKIFDKLHHKDLEDAQTVLKECGG